MNTVCVFDSDDRFSAMSAKELLESNGIICLMPNEHLTGILPHYSVATGGAKLYVSEKDYELAKIILQPFIKDFVIEKEKLEAIKLDEHKIEKCPKCGSTNIIVNAKYRRGLIAFLYLLTGVPIPAKKVIKRCEDCGLELTLPKPSPDSI